MFQLLKKYKAQLGDSIWSVCGIVLMNLVAQLALYPLLRKYLGEAGYGDMQYMMAYTNIITVAAGGAANYARMTVPAERRLSNNGDYHIFLGAVALLGIPFCLSVCYFGGVKVDLPTTICFYLLFVAMAFRYYADVIFKITLSYRKYFLYYFFVSIGYIIGALLFIKTGIWPLAILCGEMFGVLFSYCCDNSLRLRCLRASPEFKMVLKGILVLFLSESISNFILNADRLVLKIFVNASAVTIYYLSTLVGKTISMITASLNGVIIGYLARYKGTLTRKMMRYITLACLAAFVIFTGVCVLGGFIALPLFYPDDLGNVKPFLLLGSLAQVIFFTTSFVTVILIRFASKAYQVIINGVFGVCFFGIGIPATILGRLWGFAVAMVVVNGIRWLTAIVLGWYKAIREERVPATT